MTTISVPGKITALEVDESGDFIIAALTGGVQTSPTVIMPSGAKHTVIMASGSGSAIWFKLDASFNVGDVVEIYTAGTGSFQVNDENGNGVGAGGSFVGQGCILRKVATGVTAPTWGSNV